MACPPAPGGEFLPGFGEDTRDGAASHLGRPKRSRAVSWELGWHLGAGTCGRTSWWCHTGNVRALDLHSPRAVLFSCPGSSRAGDDEASRALPQEDAGPGAAGVGVCCASADILALQLGLAAVALRAEETPTHEAQSWGSAFVAARLGAPPRQRHNNTSLLWRGVATAARKRTFQC